jgi:hypothetical protein
VGGDDEKTIAEKDREDCEGGGSDHLSDGVGGVGDRTEQRQRLGIAAGLCVEGADGGGIDFARDS